MTDIPGAIAGPALPPRARVVIIGGGVIGTSVAYHLAQLGWTDVLLLEQGQLSCGTTWHAAGLVGQLRASENGTRLVQYSCELYERLEAETGLGTGFRRCGGVTVARTKDRMTQLRRTAATAEAYQLECELISPAASARALPDPARRRPRRGDLAARRRPGQPDRPDRRAGPRRPRQGRHHPRKNQGHRHPHREHHRHTASAPTRVTSRPRWWSTAPASGPRRSARCAG